MDKIKKVYIDSRCKTNGSASSSGFKFELKEQVEAPDNTVCYIDDISIPHSWYSVEEYNNRLYIQYESINLLRGFGFIVVILPTGNYTGMAFASTLQAELQKTIPSMTCVNNPARGTITFTGESISEYLLTTILYLVITHRFSLNMQVKTGGM